MLQKPPIEVVHLFPELDKELLSLLRSLDREEWLAPTIAGPWRVKDVAAHLLDTNFRAISLAGGHLPPPDGAISSYRELVDYLNSMNAVWVKAMHRVSPQLIVEMLDWTGTQYCKLMSAADLFAPAPFGVAWAGEVVSLNWFHIAREYTEKWHHQMQIRDAVGKPGRLLERKLFYPCIHTFMYGLPYALRQIQPEERTAIKLTITTEAGGDWWVVFENAKWQLWPAERGIQKAAVSLPPGVAWKLFTRGMTPAAAKTSAILEGDAQLCEAVLNMIAVMA